MLTILEGLLTVSDTKTKILETGLRMWKEDPASVTALGIAKQIKMVHGSVLYHFPDGVKEAVAAYAVEQGDVTVISQLVAVDHSLVSHLTAEQKLGYLAQLV